MELEIGKTIIETGILGVIAVFLIKNQTRQFNKQNEYFFSKMDELMLQLKMLSNRVGKTYLNQEQTIMLFKLCLSDHIQRKISFTRQVLRDNDLEHRETEVKKKIQTLYTQVTQEEAGKLSVFNTPAGDLGRILLENIEFDIFFREVYEIIFKKVDCKDKDLVIERKLDELHTLMTSYLNDLIRIIEVKIRENII